MPREFNPFIIGQRFRIVPPVTLSTPDRIDLIMVPGAFGSGEHETTASCLALLESMADSLQGSQVLDLGSGTGILAIAALKLGAANAVCVDIDPGAVETCRRNCELNGVADRVEHVCGTLEALPPRSFDLILANIYGDILLNLASDLTHRAKPGAPLLLSGILWEYNFNVRQAYERAGCQVIQNRMLEEFSSVLLKRQASGS